MGVNAPLVSLKLALSDEARASLEAVRTAQEAARARARQQTVRARIWLAIWLAILAAAFGLTAVALGPRVARSWQPRAHAPAAAPAPSSSSSPASSPASSPSSAPSAALAPPLPSTEIVAPAGAPAVPSP